MSEASLEGKIVVLTGVSRQGQVGEVVARTLAEQGAAVVLIDRTGVEAEARAKEIRDLGARAMAVKADLTDPAQLDAVAGIQAAASEAGLVPAIHANAGKPGKAMAEMGFRMITLASESQALRRGAAEHLKEAQ